MKKNLLTLLLAFISISSFAQIVWHNPSESKQNIIKGRAFEGRVEGYSRLPIESKDVVRQPLWDLSQNSAGLSVCFTTNSKNIYVKYVVTGSHAMEHMPKTGVTGVDLYMTNVNGAKNWLKGNYGFGKDTISYRYGGITYDGNQNFGSEFELFLPLYNTVKWLEIGVDSAAKFEFIPVTKERPIVVYGTSIAQGACASRPGMAWANIVARQTDNHVINLGFSGNGRLEPELFDLISQIDAKLFIIDCMPNMTNDRTPLIYDRIIAGVKNIRAKSEAPILIVEHSGYMNDATSKGVKDSYIASNVELKKGYDKLVEDGVKGLFYITKEQLGLSMDSQVDGVHPSDLGMQQLADAISPVVQEILGQQNGTIKTQIACKQNRDCASYDWNKRFQKSIEFNKNNNPKILFFGNSITHFWGEQIAPKRANGVKVWNKMFSGKSVSNLGFGWDKIENVLYRVHHDQISGSPEKIFILIGTNNLASDSNEDIIEGLKFLVSAIQRKAPKAKVHMLQILPRRGFDDRIDQINKAISTVMPDLGVVVIDCANALKGSDGKINESLFSDGVHPLESGYELLAPYITKYL